MLRPPPSQTAASLFAHYELDASFDEMFAPGHAPRDAYRLLFDRLLELPATEWRHRQQAADRAFLNQGVTFTVYGDDEGTERIFPFDLMPRIITARRVERARARAGAADHGAEPVPEGHLPRAAGSSRTASCRASWSTAASTTGARWRRRRAAATSTSRGRHRPGPRSTTASSSCSRTTCACRAACRYMLANRAGDEARLPAASSAATACGRSTTTPGAARRRCGRWRRRTGRPDHRRAHARRLQLGLLRAHLPRPADGRRAGRGPRPRRARQRRLHADHARACSAST